MAGSDSCPDPLPSRDPSPGRSDHSGRSGDPAAILAGALAGRNNLWVLTGAGISAASGFPTYRDHDRNWQHSKPVQHDDFVKHASTRRRYWARSMVGWSRVKNAVPNEGHRALTDLQQSGRVSQVVTQNVDRLHSRAGTRDVLDLHGRLDRVVCLGCGTKRSREDFQVRLAARNPHLLSVKADFLPDGDARIDDDLVKGVEVPGCDDCGGTVMPDLVFFGGQVPRGRVERAYASLARSDGVLVLGSSLSVYSGLRFIKWAFNNRVPLFAINRGTMRGCEMFDHIVSAPCETLLPRLVASLAA